MKKHFLEVGDSYMKNWLSITGSKEESDRMIFKLISSLLKWRSEGNIITKIVGHICFYNHDKEKDLEKHWWGVDEFDRGLLEGFLYGSCVNDNLVAKPIDEREFTIFKSKLIYLINRAGLVNPLFSFSADIETINNILKENGITFSIMEKDNKFMVINRNFKNKDLKLKEDE